MPGFADSMSDDQIAALLDYLRARFGAAALDQHRRDRTRRQANADRIPAEIAGAAKRPADATQRDKP